MKSIKVLDVTLRDGGCVNNFDFGIAYMNKILTALEKSGVEYIELGYIDEKNGSEKDRTQYCNEVVISEHFLKSKKSGIKYVAMVDYGKFDLNKLQARTDTSIDGIRMAFHKKNWKEVIELGRIVINKGYEFFIQPMLTMRYSDKELIELIEVVNKELPDAAGFYIVDSFGEMRGNDVVRLMHLVDNNLIKSIPLGFHSHNNLQLSYSNAMQLLEFPTDREMFLDASVMGMGKGAGNLNTEILLEHLNLYYSKEYEIASLMELIDQVINVIHKEKYWGYSVEYYLSSINKCTPSYAAHFYNKHMLSIEQVAELLGMIDDEKKNSFDKVYAEELYLEYNANKYADDSSFIENMKKIFDNKRVLIIAPGKKILEKREEINELLKAEDVISISLNNLEYSTDYLMVTRADFIDEAVKSNSRIIMSSHIARGKYENVSIIDYRNWIIKGEKTYDSAGVMSLNMMRNTNVKEILLAGFDGFSVDINNNYYDKSLRRPVSDEQAYTRNEFYRNMIQDISKEKKIRFITTSLYQEVN